MSSQFNVMPTIKGVSTILPVALAISLAYSSGTLAADEAVKAEQKSVEVITVTSQKRIQDEVAVPISVTAFSTDDIQKVGANDLNDLSEQAVNFSTNGQEGNQAAIYMRGVGTWSRNIGFDTRVGVYSDGVYLGQSSALNQAMMELEQAEILRGPQGTIFGKNTIAGAVNLISMKPDLDGVGGRVGMEIGNDGLQQFSGRLNLPLSDNTAVQLTFMDHSFDGRYENVYGGVSKEVGAREYNAYRLQLSHQFSDNFDLYLSYDKSESSGNQVNFEALSDTFGVSAVNPDSAESQDFVINTNVTPVNDSSNSGVNLTLNYETEGGSTIRSITAYRDSSAFYISDTDYSPVDFLNVDYTDDYENTSQEFQLISADNDQFEYLAGLYFYKQTGTTNRDAIPGQHFVLLNPAFGLTCVGEVDVNDPASWCLESGKSIFNKGTVDVNSWAAYGNMSYKIAKNTHVDLGLRYTSEEKKADYEVGTEDGGVNGLLFGIGSGTLQNKYEDSFVSHTLGIRHQVDNSNFYAKWSTGFKSGGFNLDYVNQAVLDDGAQFDKETVNSYEIGVKGRYLDNDLRLTLAIFKADYDDYQVNQFKENGENSSTITIENADEVNTQGLELGLDYMLTDELSVNFNYGYLDATFGSYENGGQDMADASGNPLPFAPKHSVSAGIGYERPIEMLENNYFISYLGYSYTSKQQTTSWNVTQVLLADGVSVVPFSQIDAHGLLNMRVGLQDDDDNWDIYLWGKNLLNERYLNRSLRDFFNTYTEQVADERSYGVEVNYYF